ncbi:hypothetical protein [Chryseobacterium sp. T1]
MEKEVYSYTKYFKGEKENPFNEEENYWAYKYWFYEKDYFANNTKPNEEDFKEYILGVIEHIADYFYAPIEKHIKNYFGKI